MISDNILQHQSYTVNMNIIVYKYQFIILLRTPVLIKSKLLEKKIKEKEFRYKRKPRVCIFFLSAASPLSAYSCSHSQPIKQIYEMNKNMNKKLP